MIYTRVRRGVRVCACAREALKKRAGAIFIVEGARPIAFDVWHFSREISLGVTLTAALSSESECVYLYVSRFSQSAASCWCMYIYIYIACVCEKFRCVRHLHSRFPCRPHLTGELITVFACECRRRRSGNIIGFVILLFSDLSLLRIFSRRLLVYVLRYRLRFVSLICSRVQLI